MGGDALPFRRLFERLKVNGQKRRLLAHLQSGALFGRLNRGCWCLRRGLQSGLFKAFLALPKGRLFAHLPAVHPAAGYKAASPRRRRVKKTARTGEKRVFPARSGGGSVPIM